MYKNFIKPLIDFVLSILAVLILFLPMLIISLIIVIDDPGPVFFTQKRIGKNKNGKISYFKLYKFRTMKMSTPHDIPTHMLDNPDQYITKVGKFLRKTSLDELPQIFNILSFKMAIIGPRPALWNQTDLYNLRELNGSNNVRPGLTGWAQINGRDELPIGKKAELDGYYAKNLSFVLDVKCFFGTITSVLKHEGVREGGTGMMEKEREDAKHIDNRSE